MSPARAKAMAKSSRPRRGRKAAKKETARRSPAKKNSARRGGRKKTAKKKAARRSPAKKKSARRTPKKAAKRTVRPARKPAKKSAPRRAKAAKRSASRKVTIRRTGVRTPGRHAELNIVLAEKSPKEIAAPKPRPFAGAMENASAKDLAIFDLVRARVEVQAAIQGLQPDTANRPIEAGKWSPREIVLHLHYWDREMLPYVERAWRHDEKPPHTKDQILTENDAFLGELGHHDWDEARRLLQHSREQILEELQSVPEEPAEMWSSEHALGRLIRILSHHDRHHAAVLKDARSRAPANATE